MDSGLCICINYLQYCSMTIMFFSDVISISNELDCFFIVKFSFQVYLFDI